MELILSRERNDELFNPNRCKQGLISLPIMNLIAEKSTPPAKLSNRTVNLAVRWVISSFHPIAMFATLYFSNKNPRLGLSAYLLIFYMLLGVSIASAAPSLPDSANIPKAEPQQSFPKIDDPALQDRTRPALQEPAGEDAIQVRVDVFKFSGNLSISDEELSNVLKDFSGRSLTIKDLNQAVNLITLHYRSRGFLLAQAYLPEQDISTNQVEIAIIEGQLGKLEFNAPATLDSAFLEAIAARQLNAADTIRENNLIRNITVLNSLPGIKATAQLNPGAEIGTSDAGIEIQEEPRWNAVLSANTYGNRFTGREVINGTLFLNNLAGRGDQATLNLRSSNHERQRGVQIGYLLPVHASGTLLNLNYSYVDYRLSGPFAALKASGNSEYVGIGLDQPLLRSRYQNITARGTLSYKDVTDDVAAFLLKNHRNITAAEIGLYGDWRAPSSNAYSQIGINIKSGHVDFRNNFAQVLDDIGAESDGDFVKYNIFASHMQPISQRSSLTLHAEYQGSNKNLDSAEKLAIGGINRWRAFGELPTSADRGLIAGAELRTILTEDNFLAKFLHSNLSPYIFYDAGRGVINHSALSSNNHVKSSHVGLGVDAAFLKQWYLGLAVSHQKRDIDGSGSEHETRAWGQLQVSF